MKDISRQVWRNFKRRLKKRLDRRIFEPTVDPIFTARNIHYEMADRTRGLSCGGLGAIHQIARSTGLIDALDRNVQLLKMHLPYHESDHILNIAYNILTGGACLEDLELRRNNEVYLNALGAKRIPDPTTAGDFCRRFVNDWQIVRMMDAINEVRLKVWKQQPPAFFEKAVLHADGTIAGTYGECKHGMDISYKGVWGYHPLLVSLANTKEPLFLVNRSGNRPSAEEADVYLDKAIELCRKAGFQEILMLGDTDFTHTWKLDGWDDAGGVKFIFGFDSNSALERRALELPDSDWKRLVRPPRYEVKTEERQKPDRVKEQIVRARGYRNLVLEFEDVAEFQYRPGKCNRDYRVIVLRKRISVEEGQHQLFKQYRYFFYITNEREMSAEEVVFTANDRCDQENLIEQMKNGVHAMRNPLDNLLSNWAYMVIASLAWTFKAWFALLTPTPAGRWHERYKAQQRELLKMEFKRFLNNVIQAPCQLVRKSRRIVYRLLSWSPWVEVLMRTSEALRSPLRC